MRILFSVFILFPTMLHAQNVSVKTVENVVYKDVFNPLVVDTGDISCNALVFKTDNGEVFRNGCSFSFYPDAFGTAHINIYRQTDAQLIKVGEQILKVTGVSEPVLKVGSGKSRMPAIELKNQDRIRAESDFPDNFKFAVQEFTVTIMSAETNTFKKTTNAGYKFTDATKQFLDAVKSNDFVIFDAVAIMDPSGRKLYLHKMISIY